ncbi:MAG: hypothetical protein WCJ84_06510 [Candidatus Peregrinibacteria bacterium]
MFETDEAIVQKMNEYFALVKTKDSKISALRKAYQVELYWRGNGEFTIEELENLETVLHSGNYKNYTVRIGDFSEDVSQLKNIGKNCFLDEGKKGIFMLTQKANDTNLPKK